MITSFAWCARACACVIVIAIVIVTASSSPARADEAPPPVPSAPNPPPMDPPDEAKPIEPRPELPTPPAKPDEHKPTPKMEPKAPKLEKSNGGFNEGPCWGSTAGCATAGCLPGVGTAVGAAAFVTLVSAALAQGTGIAGVCLAVGGITAGVVIGAPSAVLLGPCASGGALGGGLVGAALDDRDFAPVFIGAAPGVLTGVLASAGAVWGLAVLSNTSGDYTLPAVLLGSSAALALASGPITIIGVTVADGIAGPHDKPVDSKTAVQAGVVTARVSSAMLY